MHKYLRGAYFFAATGAIYLGLPLVGWGICAIPEFVALGPRLGYVLVVTLFALAAGWQGIDNPEGVEGGRRVAKLECGSSTPDVVCAGTVDRANKQSRHYASGEG